MEYTEELWLQNSTFFFNTTTTADSDESTVVQRVMLVVYIVSAVLGFLGNSAVIVVVAADRQLRRSASHILLASLAVVDLLYAVISLPFSAYAAATKVWPFGNAWCKVGLTQGRSRLLKSGPAM